MIWGDAAPKIVYAGTTYTLTGASVIDKTKEDLREDIAINGYRHIDRKGVYQDAEIELYGVGSTLYNNLLALDNKEVLYYPHSDFNHAFTALCLVDKYYYKNKVKIPSVKIRVFSRQYVAPPIAEEGYGYDYGEDYGY